jgi:hypothetical protein
MHSSLLEQCGKVFANGAATQTTIGIFAPSQHAEPVPFFRANSFISTSSTAAILAHRVAVNVFLRPLSSVQL